MAIKYEKNETRVDWKAFYETMAHAHNICCKIVQYHFKLDLSIDKKKKFIENWQAIQQQWICILSQTAK